MWPTKLQTSKEWEAQFPDSYAWEFDQETTDEEAIRYWVDNPDQVQTRGLSLLLFSGKGVGKTSLATTLAKEYTKRVGVDDSGAIGSFTPRFIVTDTLYELILTRSWHGLELYQKAISSDLLVLDDLRLSFKGMGANDYFERLHSCLQHRAANNLPTIITVNKIDDRKDFQANCVTDFLGVQAAELPDKFGKYRFVRLSNTALRPEPEWGI
jgi:DNA replication protein DnaC